MVGTQRSQSAILDETRRRVAGFVENRRKIERVRHCIASPIIAVPSSSEKDALGSNMGTYGDHLRRRRFGLFRSDFRVNKCRQSILPIFASPEKEGPHLSFNAVPWPKGKQERCSLVLVLKKEVTASPIFAIPLSSKKNTLGSGLGACRVLLQNAEEEEGDWLEL
ncbi:hypothetical protein MRB53_017854 [Persea americana]|uniref:Uncharacterized protein n=1 Tax=Persea americana TaxID=3435 RepID=A0ACC2M6B3_PERAE|nr:hypothetical protein MRB53_017854 [Persea americana]